MRRVLTAPKADNLNIEADNLNIEAGSANVRIVVVDGLRKNVEATLEASGPQLEEAAENATLVGNKLTVPAITGNTVVCKGGTLSRLTDDDRAAGIAVGHLTVTVRIPKGLRVTAKTRGGDITAAGLLTSPKLDTLGGDIRVDYVEGATVLHGGNVAIHNTSGVLIATTSGGNVTARWFTGDAVLNTLGGNIHAHADHPTMLSAGNSGGRVS